MNIYDLIVDDKEEISLNDVFLDDQNLVQVKQLIKEHRYIEELSKYNLPVNNKILLHGFSGCGKTTTAKAIANEIGKPILILNLSNIVSSRIGETSQNIRMLFDKAAREKAILFLDEFDQIGKARGNDDKDVGEMRRLVNTVIQLIDYLPQNSLLIAATNHPHIIDVALLRRFQLKIDFKMPTSEMLDVYYDKLLNDLPKDIQSLKPKYNVSFAEAKDYALTNAKALLIEKLERQANS
ncbi:AAA family ATPase [Empedobacter sp. UBA7494]|uniref:AAA family ATPase n=1 Tax=Empedobacter sp. UBA7494 TaxID=1946450 RepID=UPI0025BA7F2F|nr:ATP-binding protein [Empedobacter sp. UBA7494]